MADEYKLLVHGEEVHGFPCFSVLDFLKLLTLQQNQTRQKLAFNSSIDAGMAQNTLYDLATAN